MMNPFRFSARSLNTAAYLPLDSCALEARIRHAGGTGEAAHPHAWDVTVINHAGCDWQGVIRIALPVAALPRFYLPGFMYGTNRGEAPLVTDSKTPSLRLQGEFPASPWWMVRSDRLSHPVAMAFAGGRFAGLATAPYFVTCGEERIGWTPGVDGAFDQYTGFGCSLEAGEVSVTLGYENAPWFFLQSHNYWQQEFTAANCLTLRAGEELTMRVYQFDYPAQDERGLHDGLKTVYRLWHQPPRERTGVRQTVQDIASAIARDAWLPEHHAYSGFVFDRGDHFEYRPLPSIAWTNGMAAAGPMLQCAHRLQNPQMRQQAIECIDHIVEHSICERSGLPYMCEKDGRWCNEGWWYDRQPAPGHAAYLVGQCAYLVLKAYALEKAHGYEHESWLRFVQQVVARTEQTRNSDGEYPYILSERTGAGLVYDSFSGAWCLAAAAYLAYVTGDAAHLPQLLRSERYYHEAFVCRQECYGGPLDIDRQIDSEGILAYIRAVRWLHALTGEDTLLDHMQDAFHYEYTFKFCYNSPVKVPPLSTTGWCSCGGSITSVSNPHIHPMSSSVADEMYYYLSNREDAYIRSRLQDTILWSCQNHNAHDGELGYGKTGWMSERYCHCEGLMTERYADGSPASTWFALMPWACGSILEGLAGQAWEE